MHNVDGDSTNIISFSETSWRKFVISVHQWKEFDIKEGVIATHAIEKYDLELVLSPDILNVSPQSWVTIAHVTCDLPTKLRSRGSGRSKKDQDMKVIYYCHF